MNSLDYGWLNVGSLALGLIAWILPITSIIRNDKNKDKSLIVISTLSISACAVSLYFQICYNHHLVEIEDWSALMDTTSSLVKVSRVLLIVTIVLNIINIFSYRNKVSK